jgi:hypothetical protein
MLDLLDATIMKLLDQGWTTASGGPLKPAFYFTPPAEEFAESVRSGIGSRLNIYLIEVREAREFRRPGLDRLVLTNGDTVFSSPPAYVDCHYVISAWSAEEIGESTDPVAMEHRLLGEAMRILFRNLDVVPASLGVTGGTPVFQQAHIYLTVAPPDGPRVLHDFWSTMKLPWRPAVHVVATAPVDLLYDSAPAPLVTTFVHGYAASDSLDALLAGAAAPSAQVEERIQIGGWVVRNDNGQAVPDAVVRRVATGEEARTDAAGRYQFAGLRRGKHEFRAEASGVGADQHEIDVPADPPDTHVFKLQ